MVKKKKESLMDLAKGSTRLGVTSMAGLGAMGAMSSIPGMPAAAGNVTQAAGAGLTLLNVGQTAKIGMALPGLMEEQITERRASKRKSGNKYVDRII